MIMKKSIYPLAVISNLNQPLFSNTLAGITEELAHERVSEHNNPLTGLQRTLSGRGI
jgi:hypothetical protein